ncbi:hypothetical protein DV515_00019492, partial [Chloebia gouldiae]
LSRLLQLARSLLQNPFLSLGSYVGSLVASVLYCVLEPLAASINPLNDHWTLRDYAAMLLGRIFWWAGGSGGIWGCPGGPPGAQRPPVPAGATGSWCGGSTSRSCSRSRRFWPIPPCPVPQAVQQVLYPTSPCTGLGVPGQVWGVRGGVWGFLVRIWGSGGPRPCPLPQAVERVLYPHLPTYWPNLQAVLDDYSVSNAQVKADGHKVYGAILVRPGGRFWGGGSHPLTPPRAPPPPPPPPCPQVAVERLLKAKAQQAPGFGGPEGSPRHSPPGQDPSPELGSGRPLLAGGAAASSSSSSCSSPSLRDMYRELYDFFGDSLAARFGTGAPAEPPSPPGAAEGARKEPPAEGAARKMPQLTNATVSPRDEEPPPPRPALHRAPGPPPRPRGAPRTPAGHRPGARDVFQKCRFAPRGPPRFSFVIAGRQTGRRCPGRRFQTSFPQPPAAALGSRYAQRLPMIGRTARAPRRWPRAEYSLLLLL